MFKRIAEHITPTLPEVTLPKLGRTAEIPVYLIHNSPDPEDYFFLFDFEQFVERSNGGIFVRPALKVWAGRDDFGRTSFARQYREVFASEFDRMRTDLNAPGKKRGWLDWSSVGAIGADLVAHLLANLILSIALTAGKSLLGSVSLPKILRGTSPEAKLEDQIETTKEQVETALTRLDVSLPPELYEHAYRDGPKGPNSGLDREAWPLPEYVRTHLMDRKNGSWW